MPKVIARVKQRKESVAVYSWRDHRKREFCQSPKFKLLIDQLVANDTSSVAEWKDDPAVDITKN